MVIKSEKLVIHMVTITSISGKTFGLISSNID